MIDQPLEALADLLSSSETSVQCDAMRWVFELSEKIEAQPGPESRLLTIKIKVVESAELSLQRLSSEELYIRGPEIIIFICLHS